VGCELPFATECSSQHSHAKARFKFEDPFTDPSHGTFLGSVQNLKLEIACITKYGSSNNLQKGSFVEDFKYFMVWKGWR
jgi:hypothetical protein